MKIKPARPPSRTQHSDLYTEYLASPAWAATRAAALDRAGGVCQAPACGARSGLEVHHGTYERLGSEAWGDLTVLCKDCHEAADRRRQGARRGR
jgi:5-methylcytosine-specific restriction endonuclease McrA